MKRIFVIVTGLILLLALGVSAVTVNMQQTEDEMIESIVKASSNITSMKCDIAQTRRIPLMDEPQKSSGTTPEIIRNHDLYQTFKVQS